MSNRSYSALTLLAIAGLASSLVACSKEEEKKAGWSCHSADVPQGEVLRCTSAALTEDGTSTPTSITSDGYYGSTPTGGAGSVVNGAGTAGGAGSGYGVGSFEAGGTSLTSDATSAAGTITYDCFPGDTNPECPPANAYDGMDTSGAGGTSTGTSVSSDGTASSGDGTTTGGAGSSTGSGTSAPVRTDDTSSTGNGNGKGGGAGAGNGRGSASGASGSNEYPGPDECAYVPDLPYCGNGSAGGTMDGTSSTDSTDPGNGKGGGGGNGSKAGGGATTGTTDGTSSKGPTSGGGGGSASDKPAGKATGKHYKCVKDDKGNKSCESIPDCPAGSTPSNGACVEGSPEGEVLRPESGGCWVTGGGFIVSKNDLTSAPADGHDNYGGNAKPMKDGRIKGHWNHVDHGTQNHAKGRPEYIVCRKIDSEPGPGQPGCKKGHCMNQVYFGGHAEWRDHTKGVWESGYWFDVVAKDHGEPGSEPHAKNEGFPDTYHFTIRKIDDPANQASGTVVYEVGRASVKGGDGVIVGGNIQIHPPNNGHPYTQNTLPSWVKLENPAQ